MQRNRVIGGHAQVRRVIERGGNTADHNPDHQESDPKPDSRIPEPSGQHLLRKLRGVSQQKQVNERRNSEIVPVQEEIDHQQHRVDQHIQRPESDRNHLVDPVAEALERIHPKESPFKESHGNSRRGHSAQGHDNPPRPL